MAKTISTFKSELQRKLRGTSLARVADPFSTIGEAAGNVLAQIDPFETVRIAQIPNAVHDDVYDYTAPSDLKGTKVIDIRPQTKRQVSDNPSMQPLQPFDQRKRVNDDKFTIQVNSGVKSLRYTKNISPAPTVLHAMNSITANGTWAATADASNLTEDGLNFISSGKSLNFDVTGASISGFIENSTMSQVDLSEQDEIAQMFIWLFVPDTSAFTSVALRWGNDTSNFFSRTATSPHDQTAFKTGWNLVAFNWNGATETGTVDTEKIDYLRVTVTYDGVADTDFRVDNIVASNGEIYEIVYYSKSLFQNASGTFLEIPTADTDTINLDTDSFNILLYETARLVSEEVGGPQGNKDIGIYEKKLFGDPSKGAERNRGLYKLYKASNLSQAEKMRSIYYRV